MSDADLMYFASFIPVGGGYEVADSGVRISNGPCDDDEVWIVVDRAGKRRRYGLVARHGKLLRGLDRNGSVLGFGEWPFSVETLEATTWFKTRRAVCDYIREA